MLCLKRIRKQRPATLRVSLFCIPSGTMRMLSGEISMRFGLPGGPGHVVTTACISSTDSVGYAGSSVSECVSER